MYYLRRTKRYKVYSGKCLFWHYCLQLSFICKTCLRFLLICFAWEMKSFYQGSLGNEIDFRDIMNISPYILLNIIFFTCMTLFTLTSAFTVIPPLIWITFFPSNLHLHLHMHFVKIFDSIMQSCWPCLGWNLLFCL